MSSVTTAQDINTEIGASSTTTVNLNQTSVRNLACRTTGSSVITFRDCRWGINFPGRLIDHNGATITNTVQYSTTANLDMSAYSFLGGSTTTASAEIRINSNGTLTYVTASGGTTTTHISKTWLTAGTNADYTIQFQIIIGALSAGSSAGNTDLATTVTRTFLVSATTGASPSTVTASVTGNLILKTGATTLLTRPVTLSAVAQN